jgi:hypothetical protein
MMRGSCYVNINRLDFFFFGYSINIAFLNPIHQSRSLPHVSSVDLGDDLNTSQKDRNERLAKTAVAV